MAGGILIALGGNALVRPGQQGSIEDQTATLRQSLSGVVELARRGHRLVLTHGNGPQVGHILNRVEAARGLAYELPLDVCVAQSQGEIGYLIQQTLENLFCQARLMREVTVVCTRVLVDSDDPRLRVPSKPVGPFLTPEVAQRERGRGASIMEDAGRGYRRVVPSPLPRAILEAGSIRRLFETEVVVIAAGGGGIPVTRGSDGSLHGLEAVVDKDYSSTLLALDLDVPRILSLTGVDHAKLNFTTPMEADLAAMTITEARMHHARGHFAPGSMGPKIEAAIDFIERGGQEVIIALPEQALDALDGRVGTHIIPTEPVSRPHGGSPPSREY